jgi:Ca2+-binding EF-hand superfamily protein
MKTSYLAASLLSATLFVFHATAAEPTLASDAVIVARYDLNHDGKLDEAERAAVKDQARAASDTVKDQRRERRQARIKEFDLDGDGQLNDTEKAAMQKAIRAHIEKTPRLLKRLDTDRDGKLSDAEWATATDKMKERAADKAAE